MADLAITTGIGDSALYLQAVANASAPFNVTASSGQYPLLGNALVNRKLASRWLAVALSKRIFVDGLGVTSVGAESENTGMIRFPLAYLPPRIKRTLNIKGYAGANDGGTPGNGAPFNHHLPHGMQTDGFDLKFNQEYDEAAQISKVSMRLIGNDLDLLAKYTSSIPETVHFLQDADIMATHLGSAFKFANESGKSNCVAYDNTNTANGYLQSVMNDLGSKLANVKGKFGEGIVSYPREKSVYVLRYSFWNKLRTVNNGALVNSDIAQKIILNGFLSEDGKQLLGQNIEGIFNGIYIKVVPDEYWDTAAAELGLNASEYAEFNKVVGYIANGEGTMFGQSATVTDVDKSPTTSIGFIARADWGWGVKTLRPSSIALLVEEADLDDFDLPITDFEDIVSPDNLEDKIAELQGSNNDNAVQTASIKAPCLVTVSVTKPSGGSTAAATGATVTAIFNGEEFPAIEIGSGKYVVNVAKNEPAIIVAKLAGHKDGTASLDTDDTDESFGTATIALQTA